MARGGKKSVAVTPENKCGLCTGKCCTYVTQQVDTPRSMRDFDHLLWQVAHKDIEIYKDDDGWFLLINSTCTHLRPNGRCGVYEERPAICREHSNDHCEYDSPAEEGFERHFRSYEEMQRYCRKRFKNWDRRYDRL